MTLREDLVVCALGGLPRAPDLSGEGGSEIEASRAARAALLETIGPALGAHLEAVVSKRIRLGFADVDLARGVAMWAALLDPSGKHSLPPGKIGPEPGVPDDVWLLEQSVARRFTDLVHEFTGSAPGSVRCQLDAGNLTVLFEHHGSPLEQLALGGSSWLKGVRGELLGDLRRLSSSLIRNETGREVTAVLADQTVDPACSLLLFILDGDPLVPEEEADGFGSAEFL